MITTIVGRVVSIGEGRMINGQNGQTAVIDCQIAVDRGNTKKRVSLLNGKEFDCDFYKVTFFGQQAVNFFGQQSKGRTVEISGRLLQEEFISHNQTVQITPDNPLFGYFTQLVGKVPQEQLGTDGTNLYIKGHFPVNRTSMQCIEYRWKDANPNNQGGFGNFQPQQGFAGATTPGFGQPQQPQGFGQVPVANQGFQPQAQGFGQPQAQGFGQAPASQGFGTQAPQGFGAPQAPAPQMPQGFSGQTNPQTQPQFAGFGAPSAQPQGFGATQGFGAPQTGFGAVAPQAGFAPAGETVTGFTPADVANAGNAFIPETQPATPATPVTTPESNIPPASGESAPTAEEKPTAEEENQGF